MTHEKAIVVDDNEKRSQTPLQNIERLFEFHHQLPVGLAEVLAEVVLADVDGGAANLAHHHVLNLKVAAQQFRRSAGVALNADAHLLALFGQEHGLVVHFDAGDGADVQALFAGHAERCADF